MNDQHIKACPECSDPASWERVECTRAETIRYYKCKNRHKFQAEEDPKPPEFFEH